ncbi:MAG: hypothetical protein ACLFWD_00290, partial [Anaerolineales bacterium]
MAILAQAGPLIIRRSAFGRVLALLSNYLAFIAFLLAALQGLNFPLVIDIIANNMGRAIVPLAGVFAGYLVRSMGAGDPSKAKRSELLLRAGRWLSLISALVFVALSGMLPWLWERLIAIDSTLEPGLIMGAVAYGLVAWVLSQPWLADLFPARLGQNEAITGFLFLSPNLIGFLLFFAAPLLLSLFLSFTDWDSFGTRNWVGLDNYAQLFNLKIHPLASPDQVATEVLDYSIYTELDRFTLFGQSFIIGAQDKLFWIA